ncbi:uncharacterized protein LOC110038669 [Phalaenopsis equestris]|uniref:uncharacterized protein LOC110038669 n=1 Tax=Phalaenopsis equestris TaxID=78828 RepID=UPI0009E34A7C|nr:uncharacterized protein LOC110038669 [Phalaenopsis equestris]
MELTRNFFESLKFIGNWKIGLLDGRHLLIQLTIEEDYARFFAKQSVIIAGTTMKIVKWTPDFDPSKEPPVVPIWYKFLGLPLPFFKLNALFNIGRALGTPLKVDAPTYNKARPALDRIQVERDITLPEVKRIWIGSDNDGFWQNIVSEQKPYYYQHCRMFGHTVERCYRIHPPIKRNTSKDHKETCNIALQAKENSTKDTQLNNRKDDTQRNKDSLPITKEKSSPVEPSDEPAEGSPTNRNNGTASTNLIRKEFQEITIVTPSASPLGGEQSEIHSMAPEDQIIAGIQQAIEDDW